MALRRRGWNKSILRANRALVPRMPFAMAIVDDVRLLSEGRLRPKCACDATGKMNRSTSAFERSEENPGPSVPPVSVVIAAVPIGYMRLETGKMLSPVCIVVGESLL